MNEECNDNLMVRIYSSRLELHRYSLADMEFILACANLPEAAGAYMSQEHLTPEVFKERMASHFYWNRKAKAYIITVKKTYSIGLIRFWEKATDSTTALITVQICKPEERRKGYGTEAQIVLVKRLFDYCRYRQVEMHTDLNNHAQQRCLDKLGFSFVDTVVYNDYGTKRNGKLYRLTHGDYRRLSGYIY